MRKILFCVVALMLLLPGAAFAEQKIGIVNFQKVILDSEPGQALRQTLQKKLESAKSTLDREKDAISKMREDMQRQAMVLSSEAKADKEIEFKRKVRDYQDALQNYQRKLKAEEDKLSKPLFELLIKVIDTYASANGYSMILDSQSSGLLWAGPSMDLTRVLIVELNRANREKK